MGKILCLPSKRSLQKTSEKIVCNPGLDNDALWKAIELKAKTMIKEDKHCILCIDEMSFKSNLYFHTGTDEF